MRKKRMILIMVSLFTVSLLLFNSSVLAQGKEGLAHIVQQHTEKIAKLELAIKSLGGEETQNEQLSEDVKEALLKEVELKVDSLTQYWTKEDFNLTEYKLTEINGQAVLRFYTEGEHDWTNTPDASGAWGNGRKFAQNFIFNFDAIAKMYGVNLKYEFYENGEKITVFTELQ